MMNIYKNGNCSVVIFSDGTKVRRTKEDEFIPKFAENCDVKITDKCSQGCPFCYEGCTNSGKHGNLFGYKFIETLHPYTELALNGNDLDHPDLEKFLMFLKEKKVFANLTVNQNQFMENLGKLHEWTDGKLIYGLGVSLGCVSQPGFLDELHKFPNAVLHTIAGIFNQAERYVLKDKDIKVLILGYKMLQRGNTYYTSNQEDIRRKIEWLKKDLKQIIEEGWFKVLSFDNLAIEQLDIKSLLPEKDWDEFYMGDDGKYTFYIDLVKGEFAKNSISQERYPIENKTIDEMFSLIKINSYETFKKRN